MSYLKRLYPLEGPTLDSLRLALEFHDSHPPRLHNSHSLYRARNCPPEGEVEYPPEEYERIYLQDASDWIARRAEIRMAISRKETSHE